MLMLRRLWDFLESLRLLKRLNDQQAALAKVIKVMQTMHACNDCGGVLYMPHPKVGREEIKPGEFECRCKWDQSQYERTELYRQRRNQERKKAQALAKAEELRTQPTVH